MTIDERFENIAHTLDTLIKIHLDNDREYRERIDQLTAAVHELRITAQQDGENIRALARIAEIHERRLTDLEDPEQ